MRKLKNLIIAAITWAIVLITASWIAMQTVKRIIE